jgi:leader peptidase (prepilin peptidase)/N-methyltransferase
VAWRNGDPLTANFAIDLVTALWLGFVGACIGSFLNVVAYRMPRGMSVVWKPSHCPRCSHPIRARDNVPVLGWLVLRGKCRDCGQPISPRYAIVEAVMGTVFFLLAYVELFSGGANLPGGPLIQLTGAADIVWNSQWPVIGAYAYHCLLLCLLMSVMLIARDEQPFPRSLLLFAVIVGCIAPWNWTFSTLELPAWQIPIARISGALVGMACSIAVQLWAVLSKKRSSPFASSGMQWMFIITGIYAGPRGVIVAYLVSCVFVGLWNLVDRGKKSPIESRQMISVFFGVIVWMVFSPQIIALISELRNA